MRKKIESNIKAYLKKISTTEKIILISSFVGFFSSFMTWFSVSQMKNFDNRINLSFNAFNGIGAVLGYFYFLCILSLITIILVKINNDYFKKIIKDKSWIYLFLNGEALFISICTFLIYSSYGLSSAYSKIGLGLYLAIISQIIGLFASHFYFLEKQKVTKNKFETPVTKY